MGYTLSKPVEYTCLNSPLCEIKYTKCPGHKMYLRFNSTIDMVSLLVETEGMQVHKAFFEDDEFKALKKLILELDKDSKETTMEK